MIINKTPQELTMCLFEKLKGKPLFNSQKLHRLSPIKVALKSAVLLLTSSLISFASFADVNGDESVFLDPPYAVKKRPDILVLGSQNLSTQNTKALLKMLEAQSTVRSQGRRGTCSIFSATALLEFNLAKLGLEKLDSVDLSEQWLEYLTAGQSGQEGSWSYVNLDRYGDYGYVQESLWPYNSASWTPYDPEYWETEASFAEKQKFEKLCGPYKETFLFEHCLIGQRHPDLLAAQDSQLNLPSSPLFDPEFAIIRAQGAESVKSLAIQAVWAGSNKEILEALDSGEPVIIDVDFFYEAWNHGRSESLGLQRDLTGWEQGEVSYPHRSSKDYEISRKSENRAGHSVVIVGYDRERVIEKTVKDLKGAPLKVKTKGVYYFKNSWGQEGFGRLFNIEGKKFPGYGMISMDYAHEYGSFTRMFVGKK